MWPGYFSLGPSGGGDTVAEFGAGEDEGVQEQVATMTKQMLIPVARIIHNHFE